MSNINTPIIFNWIAPTHRRDGQMIGGTITYEVRIVGAGSNDRLIEKLVNQPTFTLVPSNSGFKPGKYKFTVQAIETTAEETNRSARSDPFQFSLESIADPLPPTGISVQFSPESIADPLPPTGISI